eukprot:COSAG04_NODE_30124_length_264_cov_1.072727_1_plen_42_part_01
MSVGEGVGRKGQTHAMLQEEIALPFDGGRRTVSRLEQGAGGK